MRVVPLSPALVGEVLARPVTMANGQILVGAGISLTPSLIEGLQRRGVVRLVVKDWLLDDVEIDEAIQEETRTRAVRSIDAVIDAVGAGRTVNLNQLAQAVTAIVDELRESENVVFSLSALRCHDDYTFVHSVNVCVLATIVGIALGYSRDRLTEIGLGAILHDLGKVRTSGSILTRAGPLTEAEWREVQAHPWDGYYLMVRRVGATYLAAHASLDHHERLDGSGYPRGIGGGDISLIGRLVAICDVYDALTSDRVYRKRQFPHLALAHLLAKKGILYDPHLAELFSSRMAPYPNGSVVMLNTKEIAVVVEQRPQHAHRPRVRIVSDQEGHRVSPHDVELSSQPEITIAEVLEDYPPALGQELRSTTASGSAAMAN